MTGKEFKELYDNKVLSSDTEYKMLDKDSEEEYIIYINDSYELEIDIENDAEQYSIYNCPTTFLDNDDIEISVIDSSEYINDIHLIPYKDIQEIQNIFDNNEKALSGLSYNLNEEIIQAVLQGAQMIKLDIISKNNPHTSQKELEKYKEAIETALEASDYIYDIKDGYITIYLDE